MPTGQHTLYIPLTNKAQSCTPTVPFTVNIERPETPVSNPTENLTVVNDKEKTLLRQPTDLQLSVAPNPIQNQATIEFTTPYDMDVTISLFDLLGKRIHTIFTGNSQAQNLTILPLSTQNLASGIYFLQLTTTNGNTQTQKITVQ